LPFGNTVWRTGNYSANYLISGWQLSGILTAQSGSVFTPIISSNISGASEEPGDTTDRPNLVGNPIPAQQTPNQWISVAAFAPPAPLHFGNAGRNILVGPGLFSWDFAMLCDFHLTESKTLEFRFEMFNLTNRLKFDFPENDLASPSFGQTPLLARGTNGRAVAPAKARRLSIPHRLVPDRSIAKPAPVGRRLHPDNGEEWLPLRLVPGAHLYQPRHGG
jgi:hypothetical protein